MGLISPSQQINIMVFILVDCDRRPTESDVENKALSAYSNGMTISDNPYEVFESIQCLNYIYNMQETPGVNSRIGCFEGVHIKDLKCDINLNCGDCIISYFYIKFNFSKIEYAKRYFEMISRESPFSKEAKMEYGDSMPLELFEI